MKSKINNIITEYKQRQKREAIKSFVIGSIIVAGVIVTLLVVPKATDEEI